MPEQGSAAPGRAPGSEFWHLAPPRLLGTGKVGMSELPAAGQLPVPLEAGSQRPPGPACLSTCYAQPSGESQALKEPASGEPVMDGETEAQRGKCLVLSQPFNHPTNTARAHGAPG